MLGPAAVSPREQAATIGMAVGEPVRCVELTRAEAEMVWYTPRNAAAFR